MDFFCQFLALARAYNTKLILRMSILYLVNNPQHMTVSFAFGIMHYIAFVAEHNTINNAEILLQANKKTCLDINI